MNASEVICIIVTFNRADLLKKVVYSVLNQTKAISKLIIIDNNSQDNTLEIIESFKSQYSNIIYHNTGSNLGGAGGFHAGFTIAENYSYEFLWVMDDDCLPDSNCLEELLRINVEDVGIVQPMRYNIDGSCAELSPVIYDLKNPFKLNPKIKSVIDCYHSLKDDSLIELHGVPFEGPLISKKLIQDVGFPNPAFFIFYDDLDFSIRARKLGYKIFCSRKAIATRLLTNNQRNDLKSWKGYFMLRNLFYIHSVYGENIFVKIKPYFLASGYSLLSLLRFDIVQLKVIYAAIRDSKNLANTDFFKPTKKD